MFQPIVRVAPTAKERPHYELLLRLHDENGAIVLPDEFIPAAERFNLMPSLDRWVIEKVLRDYVPSTRDGVEEAAFTVAVNLSGTTLSDPSFLEFLIDALEAHEPTPGVLCFEVTETAAITNLGHASYLMREMASRGCLIALDDFGSGLSRSAGRSASRRWRSASRRPPCSKPCARSASAMRRASWSAGRRRCRSSPTASNGLPEM
jgi:EAL domain-containing protein (putative c-di-GMP-specific phosphodiesterase class I)